MFCIVLHHYAYHGSIQWAAQYNHNILATEKIYLFLCCLGKAAVVAFVLIGAYFLSEKQFKLWRVVNLCTTTFVYSWLIYLILAWKFPQLIANVPKYSIWLPIPIPSNYWFVISYVYMLCCMPFMNLILHRLNRRQLLSILVLMFMFWNILQFITNKKLDNDQWNFFTNNNYFLFIYLIAGYIRRYRPKNISKIWSSFVFLLFSLTIVIVLICNVSKNDYGLLGAMMATLNNPFSLILGIAIFSFFNNLNIGSIPAVNFIASSMFGVYLIHDNSFIRPFLWHTVSHSFVYANNPLTYFNYGLTICILTFISCILIDIVKRYSIDFLVNRFMAMATARYLKWTNGNM